MSPHPLWLNIRRIFHRVRKRKLPGAIGIACGQMHHQGRGRALGDSHGGIVVWTAPGVKLQTRARRGHPAQALERADRFVKKHFPEAGDQ
jgi:hypothetical protein